MKDRRRIAAVVVRLAGFGLKWGWCTLFLTSLMLGGCNGKWWILGLIVGWFIDGIRGVLFEGEKEADLRTVFAPLDERPAMPDRPSTMGDPAAGRTDWHADSDVAAERAASSKAPSPSTPLPPPPPPAPPAWVVAACAELGLEPDFTLPELRRAYRRLVVRCHPDRYARASASAQQVAHERVVRLTEAYDALRRWRGA